MAGPAVKRRTKDANVATKSKAQSTVALRERRINLRATTQQETLIREAAKLSGETLTDFILRTAYDKATSRLMDTRQYILPPDKWKLFLQALDRPPVVKPALRRLFSQPSILERSE